MKRNTIQQATFITLSAIALTGCSAMWPRIGPDSDLKPITGGANNIPCITYDYSEAKSCALQTIEEISKLLEAVGQFDRATAYSALGIGTITGGVLAYKGSEHILKGLAVVSGGLLGLNSTVNTKQQRIILEKGLKDMTCSLRAAEALNNFNDGEKSEIISNLKLDKDNIKTSTNPYTSFINENRTTDNKTLEHIIKFNEQKNIEAIKNSRNMTLLAIATAKVSAGQKLSNAVIQIRAEIRSKLSDIYSSTDGIYKSQSDRIVDMTGEIIRRRSEQLKNSNQSPIGDSVDSKSTLSESMQTLSNASNILDVFRDCTEPATQREIEK